MAKHATPLPTNNIADTPLQASNLPAAAQTTDVSSYEEEIPEGLAPGSGAGISDRSADNLIPMISVLQPLSPQLDDTKPDRYIQGARAGMIMLSNSIGAGIVEAAKGFLFQPCHFKPVWIEWVDRERGGGFVARYDDDNGKPALPTARAIDQFSFVNPATGNKITNHYNHIGYVISKDKLNDPRRADDLDVPFHHDSLPAMISFKSSGISESKKWMQIRPRWRDEANGIKADAFDYAYHMVSVPKTNNKGKWWDLRAAKRVGFVKASQIAIGKELFAQARAEKVQGDMSSAEDHGVQDRNSDEM